MEGAGDGGDGLHGSTHTQRLPRGHAALGATRSPRRAREPTAVGHDLVLGERSSAGSEIESVTDLDALDCLDSHQCRGKFRVDPSIPVHMTAQTRRESVDNDLDDTAQGVAVAMRRGNLSLHALTCRRIEGAHRVVVDVGAILSRRHRIRLGDGRPDADHMAHNLDLAQLPQERARDRSQGDAGRRLAGTCALQHRTCVVEAVLLHANEVGVARAGPRQRSIARERGQLFLINRVR